MESPSLEFRIALLEQQVAKLISEKVNDVIIDEVAKSSQVRLERFLNSYDLRGDL